MKKILPIIFFIFCSAAFAFNGWLGIKNEKFTIFYKKEHEYTAKELMKNLNEVYSVAEKTTGNNINMVYFVIDDFGSVVNGFADPTHSESIHIFTFSPDSRELAMSENWYKTVGVHEYTHMLQIKNSSGIPGALSSVFGSNASFIFPVYTNLCVPAWITEGITTYTESQFSKYSGRLNDGYFDAYLLARLKEEKRVNIGDVNYSSLGFPYGSYYLYGGLFFRYLSQTYGEEKLGDFFDKQGGSLKSYLSPLIPAAGMELNCKSIYGKSFAKLWNEWQDFEVKRAENFKQDGEKITDLKDYSSKTTIYNGELYYIRQYLDYTSASTSNARYEIWRKNLTTNKDEIFYKSTSEILPNLVFKDGYLYFSVENYRTGFGNSSQYSYGVDKRILKLNLSTKDESEITRDKIRCFTVNSDNSIFISIDKIDSFGSDIYKLNPNGNSKVKVTDSKMLINEMVTYNDRIFVSAKSQSDNFGIFEFSLSDNTFTKIADTPYLESQISIYDNKLFFISNNNSQYRSYYVDLTTNELFSLTESGYSTYPAYCKESNKLYYIGINSNGNNIYLKEFTPIKTSFENYNQNSLSDTDFADLKYEKASYSENLYSLLKPTSRYFSLGNSAGKNYYAISVSGSDKVFDIPYYSLSLEYDESKDEKFDFSFSLENNLLLPVTNTLEVDKDSFSAMFSYPLLTNSKKGFQSVYGAMLLKSENDFNRKTISPIVSLSVKYPDNSSKLYIEAPFESKTLSSSSNNRLGLVTSISSRQSFNRSFIQATIKSIHNPKGAFIDEDYFPDVRGYSDTFYSSDLLYGSLNYSINLFKVRRGVWNPNIYAGDISMNLFADTSFERKKVKNRQLSSGVEFSTLTGIGFGSLALTPTIRVSFPEKKSPVYNFAISSSF